MSVDVRPANGLAVKISSGSFKSACKKLSSSYDSRYKDYNGIKKDMSKIPTSRSYLGDASYYMQQKMDKLNRKKESIDSFRENVANFVEHAKDCDKQVANRIKTDAKSFYKTVGIKTGFIAAVGSLIKGGLKLIASGFSSLKKSIESSLIFQTIKDFYENKFLPWWKETAWPFIRDKVWPVLRVVIDVVLVILAAIALVAVFAVSSVVWMAIGIIAAGFGLYKALSTFVKDTVSASYHLKGEDEYGEEIHNLKDRDMSAALGRRIDQIFNTHFFEDFNTIVWDELTIIEIIYDVGEIGKSIFKGFKDHKGFKTVWEELSGVKFKKRDILQISLETDVFRTIKGTYSYKGLEYSSLGQLKRWREFSNIFKSTKNVIKYGKMIYKGIKEQDTWESVGGVGKIGDKAKTLKDTIYNYIDFSTTKPTFKIQHSY